MIAFACKQCGKRFDRPADACGTLVFCPCGAGTRVPWESTLPPGAEPIPTVKIPLPLRREEWPRPAASDYPSVRRFQSEPRDRNFCFNHPTAPMEHTCADCGESFCAACVVTTQGGVRCGPCKNFRVRAVQRPARLSVLALLSPIIGLLAGAVWVFILLAAVGARPAGSLVVVLGAIGVLPQVAVMAMAAVALRNIESEARMGGRELAITGLVAALVSAVLIVQLTLILAQVVGE